MRIVGINSGLDARLNHIFGGAAALVEDGHIRFAVAEERITRRKYDGGYTSALRYLLDRTGLCLEDIDYFYLTFYGSSLRVAKDLIAIHLEDLRVNDDKLIVIPSHHESHAALAYFLSPFSDALTVVADNEGSVLGTFDPNKPLKDQWCERNTYYWCWDNQYQLLERDFAGPGEMGFGKAYNKFTRYLGFGDYHHAGKTMGLSAYGTQSNLLSGPSLWGTTNKGDLVSKMKDTNDYTKDLPVFFGQYDINIPSPAARHCAQVPEYQALAAFVQSELQRWIAIRCGDLMRRVSTKHLCISGGVALNSLMNGFLERELRAEVFVPPYPSDQGQALGNAIIGFVRQFGLDRTFCKHHRFSDYHFLGGEFSDKEHEDAIQRVRPSLGRIQLLSDANLFEDVAHRLERGELIGWFQGRSEYGARALGNRSLLGDPRRADMKDRLNRLKGRESFRPLAPAVLAEEAHSFFERAESILLPGMNGVVDVLPVASRLIPSAVHVDGTARAQVVSEEFNARFYHLIRAFYAITGTPVLINTSFNLSDEPIVETPADALQTFVRSSLDCLVLGNYVVTKGD